jgi:hypothetical protein
MRLPVEAAASEGCDGADILRGVLDDLTVRELFVVSALNWIPVQMRGQSYPIEHN